MELLSLGDLTTLPYVRQADYAARNSWSYGERRILDYLLVYIEKGICKFTINYVNYEFQEGDYCLVQPTDLVLLEGLTKTITPFAHLDFFYNKNREKSFPTSPGMTNITKYRDLIQPRLNNIADIDIPYRFRPSNPVFFRNKFLRLIGRWKDGTENSLIEVQQLGIEILLELLRDFGPRKEKLLSSYSSLDRVSDYISLHLHESITVQDMAEQSHLSISRFTAVFRKKYGVSPYQYLLRLRIDRATEMIQTETDLTISQIADYCGFNNIQHFSNYFQQTTGLPPSHYRKKK